LKILAIRKSLKTALQIAKKINLRKFAKKKSASVLFTSTVLKAQNKNIQITGIYKFLGFIQRREL
jgi:hypothetical protein